MTSEVVTDVVAAYRDFLSAVAVNDGAAARIETWKRLDAALMALSLAEDTAAVNALTDAAPTGIELGPVVAVYVVPEDDGPGGYDTPRLQEPCVVVELVGGPKPYARLWPRKPYDVDWGWGLPDSAIRVATGVMPG